MALLFDRFLATTRRVLQGFRNHSAAREDYRQRLEGERQSFNDCLDVHDLPEIFHYWSNKHLAPLKFHQFGITDPEQFFFLYASRLHARTGRRLEIVSLGCGNCDMEARMAKRLAEAGIRDFRIDCLDINEAMLERGREHARVCGVEDHVAPACADFNDWRPSKQYDIVIAN